MTNPTEFDFPRRPRRIFLPAVLLCAIAAVGLWAFSPAGSSSTEPQTKSVPGSPWLQLPTTTTGTTPCWHVWTDGRQDGLTPEDPRVPRYVTATTEPAWDEARNIWTFTWEGRTVYTGCCPTFVLD